MNLRIALRIAVPVLERYLNHAVWANKTPAQRIKFNQLTKAVKYLRKELEK